MTACLGQSSGTSGTHRGLVPLETATPTVNVPVPETEHDPTADPDKLPDPVNCAAVEHEPADVPEMFTAVGQIDSPR